jgi:hypothetical protein
MQNGDGLKVLEINRHRYNLVRLEKLELSVIKGEAFAGESAAGF